MRNVSHFASDPSNYSGGYFPRDLKSFPFIVSVRTLWLSGVFFAALDELEKKKDRNPEEESQYQNMLLTIKSDRELKQFLTVNIKALQAIADEARKENLKKADKLSEELHPHKVFPPDDHPGIIEINIGGMLNNSVGFLYVPEGRMPPAMSSGGTFTSKR
jgi:hypothetical protein